MTMEKLLQTFGCDIDADEFRDLIQEVFSVMHPAWTDEDMLYHPRDAIRYCEAIRCRTDCDGLSDEFVLRSLVNIRKSGRNPKRARAKSRAGK